MLQIKITQQSTGAQKAFFIAPDEAGKLFIEAYGDGENNIGTTHCDLFQNNVNGILSLTPLTLLPHWLIGFALLFDIPPGGSSADKTSNGSGINFSSCSILSF